VRLRGHQQRHSAGAGAAGSSATRLLLALILSALACASPARQPAAAKQSSRAPRPPINAERVLARLTALPAPRTPGTAGHRRAQQHLMQSLQAMGLEPQRRTFSWSGLPGIELANIEVRLAGPAQVARGGAAPDALLLCAHFDSVPGSPGADDNGSGVAALLEVARRLAGRELPAELRLLLVDAEERGLVGSRHYVRSLSAQARRRIAGVINLESVGYTDRRPGVQTMPAATRALLDPGDVGDFVLVLGNQASAPLVQLSASSLRATAAGALRVVDYDRLAGAGWLIPDSRRSDHASFWDANIPAVMLTDTAPFRNPHYHRPDDRPETLDGEFLAAVARGVERAALLWAAAQEE